MADYPPLPRGRGVDGGLPPATAGGGDSPPSSDALRGSAGSRWSDLFHMKSLTSGGFDLHYDAPLLVDGKRVAKCGSSLLEEGVQQWRLALVGHFIGRRPGFSHVQTSIIQQWKPSGNVKIILLESGFFVFKFSLQEDMMKVLDAGFWTVMGRLLILRPWNPHQNLKRISLSSVPVWIRLPNLPFHYWTAEALSVLGSVLGRPLASDAQTKLQNRLSYARLCVEIEAENGFPHSNPFMMSLGLCLSKMCNMNGSLLSVLIAKFLGTPPINVGSHFQGEFVEFGGLKQWLTPQRWLQRLIRLKGWRCLPQWLVAVLSWLEVGAI